MKKYRSLIACLLAITIIPALFLYYQHSDRQSMIDCTLEWGRLAPFPSSRENFTITTEGNMFTRGFKASFKASPQEIEKWLQNSDGAREATQTHPSPNIRHFEITPGGGAQKAEVTVDDNTHTVSVHVYWS